MQELLKPFLEKLIEYIDNNNYFQVSFIILGIIFLFIGLGYFLSWFFQIRKLKKENEKLNWESKEKELTLLEKLQRKRNDYVKDTILIQLSVKLCIDSLVNQNEVELKKNRDELIDIYFNELVPKFTEYIEVCEIYYKGDTKKIYNCIIDEALPFFETTEMFIEAVNNQNIISILQVENVTLKKFTINPVIKFVKNYTRFYNFEIKKKLNAHLSVITLS